MSVGFIGMGGIASAMVRGLIRCSNFDDEIFISRRGQANATSLAGDHTKVGPIAKKEVDPLHLSLI